MQKKTSLKDIAEKLGVSTALVSYVLNNKKEGRISKDIAAKIREAALELKYTTNQIAKSLKTRRTNTIGLIVSDISNPFSSSLARIIQEEADKNGFTVIFGSSDENPGKSAKLINVFLDRQVDGFIIAATEESQSQILELKENGIPVVLIDRYFPGMEVSYVVIDNFDASYRAVNYLANSGAKRIAIITHDSTLVHMQERLNGYLHALKERNLPVDEDLIKKIQGPQRKEEVEKAIDILLSLKEPAEAILFTSNVLSTAALKYLNTLPVKVPDNMSIISFDESDAAYLFYAPLTHMKQPLERIGKLATDMLLGLINKDKEITNVMLQAELVIGRSTLRVRNEKVDG